MANYREILRLYSLGTSQRSIAREVQSSRDTVADVIKAAEAAGIAWPLDDDVTNGDIQEILFPGKYVYASPYTVPDYQWIHTELAKKGVTLTLLWDEYCQKVRSTGGVPYMYTQFCEKYRRWARLTKATMNNPSTVEQLREMRFSAMATEFEAQIQDPTTYTQVSFEDRFGLLVNAEWNRRQTNKLVRRIRDAHLDIPSASMEGIEYYEDRKLDKAQMVRFSTCNYIEEEHHIILKGATGNGKTYIACALGNAACRKFKSVRYVRMPELLDELTIARAENMFRKVTKAYSKVDLLILDEWLMRPLTLQQSFDLFEIVEARTKHGSTIFCTQYDTDDWYDRINTDSTQDSPINDAIMDRIVHNAYIVSVEGAVSMRERHGLSAQLKAGGGK